MRRLLKLLLALALLVALLVVLILLTSNLYRIPSSAMEPTLHCAKGAGCQAKDGDRVLVSRLVYRLRDPRRGDIVAFRITTPGTFACNAFFGEVFIKRIVALPGERWRETGGFIYINGRKLNEPYVRSDTRDREPVQESKVPAGQYVVLGDNRSSSCDSRQWGYLPRKNLIGPLMATYWPLSRISIR